MAGKELAPRYNAAEVEQKWYAAWEAAGLFQPDPDPGKPVFCITIPPPNITGSLHMGHALCYPLQDMLGRYQRLLGMSVLVLPGQDHAGIATQSVVEKQLRAEGSSGAKIGREKFVERVWEWRKQSGDTILHQFRRFGCAFDWSRSRFTLDDQYVDAVMRVFIDWFERGLIFRGKRVVNWDPILQTSVSDIETERKNVRGKLYYIDYPFVDGSGSITIATTRPETMLADVAVAVHPSDKRYKDLVGKKLTLPLLNREIPLIADQYPDPAFGSGAVKITPAHDPNDFEVGRRHDLDMPVLIDPRGKIAADGGPYAGLDRYEARKRIVADLESQGFLSKVEDHEVPLLISERSGEPIEPLLSEQWFVDQPSLAIPAIEAVKSGRIRFHPDRYNRIYLDWMENIREWCVSRQLWWGHRIPVYYDEDGRTHAALSWDQAQEKAGRKKIVRQDDDVMDTWFSSGLWPFATLGWPEQTADMKRFYPTSALITDRNIINLWVARMIMMGLDQAGDIPYSDVYIYATVLTEDGRRMSKSLGTGVDPMGVIEAIGADALRYTLQSQTGENQDIRYSERRTEDARNFCNKIWNATRFVLMNLGDRGETPSAQWPTPKTHDLEPVDRWLLSRLHATESEVRDAYDRFDLQSACQALYRFFWSELCDWYIEIAKPRLVDPAKRGTPQSVLLRSLEAFAVMLHPVMPHLTEEIYSHLPLANKADFVMSAKWPELPDQLKDDEAERAMERAFDVTKGLRALRAAADLAPFKTVATAYFEGSLDGFSAIVAGQAWVEALVPGRPADEKCLTQTVAGVKLHLPVEGLVDLEKKAAKLSAEEERVQAELAKVEGRLGSPAFVERAKAEVVDRDRQLATELKERLGQIADQRKLFGIP